ncbi:MAG: hypothetical protein H8E87_06350, partial [FCB group bacterium]|nr:hypothetical protein [FCB group bacterium]
DGIDASQNGDTVLVAPGNYTYMGNYNVDFLGKSIAVISETGAENTVIECRESGRGFIFQSSEDEYSVLEGFTISGGHVSLEEIGGAILCYQSSPTIRNNILTSNYAYLGGGIGSVGGAPVIENNIIYENTAERGGGIYCTGGSQALIIGNEIYNNFSQGG